MDNTMTDWDWLQFRACEIEWEMLGISEWMELSQRMTNFAIAILKTCDDVFVKVRETHPDLVEQWKVAREEWRNVPDEEKVRFHQRRIEQREERGVHVYPLTGEMELEPSSGVPTLRGRTIIRYRHRESDRYIPE